MILKWLHKEGYPCNWKVYVKAVAAGHVHILHWAKTKDIEWNPQACERASENGHLKVLKWVT